MTVLGWRPREVLAARDTSRPSCPVMGAALEVEQLIASGRPGRPADLSWPRLGSWLSLHAAALLLVAFLLPDPPRLAG